MHFLSTKHKFFKSKLKTWNNEIFDNVHNHVKMGEQELHVIQEQIQFNGYSDAFSARKMLKLSYKMHGIGKIGFGKKWLRFIGTQ